jgi:acyl-phosphate glycerol 3-phosphate acyltransferase
MPSLLALAILTAGSYLVGSIPFGYLIGRLKGIDLFKAGSGNIGATNVGRTLGRKYGLLVFALDFLKGALPTALAPPLASLLAPSGEEPFGIPDLHRIAAAASAILGHLFPIYLGFRGGKGVATGAGVAVVLVPVPAAVGLLFWLTVVLCTRLVSLASLAAAVAIVLARLTFATAPFSPDRWLVTAFCLVGAAAVVIKHAANIRRLFSGTENRLEDRTMRQSALKMLHVLAVGTWFGGAMFFSFVAAPAIFASFEEVVNDGPSDRTAHRTIIPAGASDIEKRALANALAGSAVGPVFPRFFLMQAVSGAVALATALSWWNSERRTLNRVRVVVLALALLGVVLGWPLSEQVSRLRVERFTASGTMDPAVHAAFVSWHLASLALSAVTTLLAGAGLALAGRLPADR